MAVIPRPRKDGTIAYQVSTYFKGETYFESAGLDKREAARLDARNKRAVKAGTFAPKSGIASNLRKFLEAWFSNRKAKANRTDHGFVRNHVYPREWFVAMRLNEIRPRHLQRLIEEIQSEGKLSPKTVSNIYAVLRTAFRHALREELITVDPCLLRPGTLSKRGKTREIYSRDEARLLVTKAGFYQNVWNALGLYTGMRMGEISGRRWRDWARDSLPLGALTVTSQYDDQTLKTDRPRRVPVHPELAVILKEWWDTGFELHFMRRPTADDFIVPNPRDVDSAHTKTTAYKRWRIGCLAAGVENRSEHSVRHTFITLARRAGARGEVLEAVTHNASGSMVDQYTHWEWAPLCEAVGHFPSLREIDAEIDAVPGGLDLVLLRAPTPGLEAASVPENFEQSEKTASDTEKTEPPKSAGFIDSTAETTARQFSLGQIALAYAALRLGVLPANKPEAEAS